ncbi:MAG: hypothetical protein LBU70_09860 [Chitinispirillales bacterium]|nr:hypothetical protein [Chitinispirillales bacterium]
MPEKKLTPRWLLVGIYGLLPLLLLFCERSDVITGAGGDAASVESLLEDAQRVFVSVNLDSDDVDLAFSLPRNRNPGFSTHIQAGYLMMGVNRDGDTLAAHAQFGVTAAFLAAALYREGGEPDDDAEPDDNELSAATLYFRVADNLDHRSSDPDVPDMPVPVVPIYLCEIFDVADSAAPVNRGAKLDDIELDALDLGTDSGAVIPIPLRRAIFMDRDLDSLGGFGLAFCIVDYDGVLRKVSNPYMVAEGSDTTVTIQAARTRFTTFENSDMVGTRAAEPYSSWYTKRTAVFRVDLAKIMDTPDFGGSGNDLASAVIAIEANWNDGVTDSSNVNRYKALFFTDGDERFADAANGADTAAVLQSIFNDWGTPEPALARPTDAHPAPFDPHSIRPLMVRALNNHSQGTAGPHIYVYLRPTSENSTILWEKPSKLETILHIPSLQ